LPSDSCANRIYRYFSLLIGRLGLAVPELKLEYENFDKEVLSYRTPSGLVDEKRLDSYLKAVVEKRTGDQDTLMFEADSLTRHCQT
jgi:hypothetical protein